MDISVSYSQWRRHSWQRQISCSMSLSEPEPDDTEVLQREQTQLTLRKQWRDKNVCPDKILKKLWGRRSEKGDVM